MSSQAAEVGVRPRIVAHRGAKAVAPENTLAAFDAAVACGAQMIELDVQLSADGVPVVFHDDGLMRCTDVARALPERAGACLAQLSCAELAQLDASAGLPGYPAGERTRIPRLEAVLDWLLEQPAALALNIELKSQLRGYPGLVEIVVAQLRERELGGRILVSSFDHRALVALKRLAPELKAGALVSDGLVALAHYARHVLGVDAINPSLALLGAGASELSGAPFDGQLVAEARAEGLEVYVWTVNEMAAVPELRRLGVDGIISDYPAELAAALADSTGSTDSTDSTDSTH